MLSRDWMHWTVVGSLGLAAMGCSADKADSTSTEAAKSANKATKTSASAAASSSAAPTIAPTAAKTAAPKIASFSERMAFDNPLAPPMIEAAAFDKPMWAHGVGTMKQLEVPMPKGWKSGLGGYEGMNSGSKGKAWIGTMGVLSAYADPTKGADNLTGEAQRWFKTLLELKVGAPVALPMLSAQMQKGTGLERSDKPGCMSPTAPPACKIEVAVVLLFVPNPHSTIVVGIVPKDSAEPLKMEMLAAVQHTREVDAVTASVKGTFPAIHAY